MGGFRINHTLSEQRIHSVQNVMWLCASFALSAAHFGASGKGTVGKVERNRFAQNHECTESKPLRRGCWWMHCLPEGSPCVSLQHPPPPPALFRLVPHTSSSFCGDSVPRSIHRIPAFSASSSRFPHRGVPQHLPRCSTGHNRSAPFLRQHLISAAQRLHLDAVMAM